MRNRWSRNLWIAGLVVIVLAVASVPLFNALVYTPANTAKLYLKSLAQGDAEQALALLAAPPADPGNALSPEVLQNAPSVPSQVKVKDSAEVDDDHYSVTLTYNLGANNYETVFSLERSADTWGLFRTWKISLDAWPTLELDVSGADIATINGVSVPVADAGIPVFFPLEYSVGFNAQYLQSSVERVAVTGGQEDPRVKLEAQPTQALTDKVQEIVNAQVDQCAEQKVLMPTGCSFGYTTNNDILGDVTWSVDTYPTVELKATADGLEMVSSGARFTVEGRYRDAVTAMESDFRETVDTQITAMVSVVDDQVIVNQTDAQVGGS